MNKRQVFSLYLVNENQKVSYRNEITCDLEVVSKWDDTCDIVNSCGNFLDCCDIEHCQLILKRISGMSYENWVELSGYVFDLKLVNETAITMRDLLCNGDGAVLSLKSMTKIMFWLIQNGYALDDEWFTNGIAVEEKTK